jgi:hypothetical protein
VEHSAGRTKGGRQERRQKDDSLKELVPCVQSDSVDREGVRWDIRRKVCKWVFETCMTDLMKDRTLKYTR